MKKDADNLIYNLNVERDEKAKDQMECNRLRDGVAMKERDCQDNDGRIKAVDYDLYKAQERCGDLTKLADQRSIELKRMQEALACSSAENARARDDEAIHPQDSIDRTSAQMKDLFEPMWNPQS